MSNDAEELGAQIAAAAENEDAAVAASAIRSGDFIVFQQVDPENAGSESEEAVSVVLAQVDEDTAVVCFSDQRLAQVFAEEISDEIPPGQELPAVILSGDVLLDGLPDDCGLLVNPGSTLECYFPPGSLP
jgi:hypothetical protein